MKLRTVELPAGLALFHGTSVLFRGVPRGPAWFSNDADVAWAAGQRASFFERRHKPVRLLVFQLRAPVEVVDLGEAHEFHDFASGDNVPPGRLRDFMELLGVRVRGRGETAPWNRLAAATCDAGYGGWIIRGLFEDNRRAAGHDVMLCEPEDALEHVREDKLAPLTRPDRRRARRHEKTWSDFR